MGVLYVTQTYPEELDPLEAILMSSDAVPNDLYIVQEPTIGVGSRAKEIGKTVGREVMLKAHIPSDSVFDAETNLEKWRNLANKVCVVKYYIRKGEVDEVKYGPLTVLIDSLNIQRKSPTRFEVDMKITEVTVF